MNSSDYIVHDGTPLDGASEGTTPRPWTADEVAPTYWSVYGADGACIAELMSSERDAALIVTAVNSHATHLARIAELERELADLRAIMTETDAGTIELSLRDGLMHIGQRAAMLVPTIRVADKARAELTRVRALAVELCDIASKGIYESRRIAAIRAALEGDK